MANTFIGTGNLGSDPVLTSPVGEDERRVADLRVYFDKPVKNRETGEYEDKGGFWLDVSAWDRLADDAMRTLMKGARVRVEGSLKHNVWTDEKSGEEKSKFVLYADDISLSLVGVESAQRRLK
jgi:single-strand DNA-binding protein